MTYTYIKFDSVTLAEKARSLLTTHKIKSRIRRNPNPNHKEGCNYALVIDNDVWKAYDLINAAKIKNLGVESYRERI